MSFRILHLSDLHFGPKNHYQQTGNPMLQAVDALEDLYLSLTSNYIVPVFDAVVLSGDFTWGGNKEGFEIAERFVRFLEVAQMCARQACLVIPGNHDISWTDDTGTPHSLIRSDAEGQYRSFVGRLGLPSLSDDGYLGFIGLFKAARVVIVGLNSARLESNDTRGIGYVGFDQVFAVMEALRIRHIEESTGGGDVLLASLHHHLYRAYDVPMTWLWNRWQPSITLDALDILRALDTFNFRAVMHGHMHKRTFHDDVVEHGHVPDRRHLPVFGAGSLCVQAQYCDDQNPEHHYHVLEVKYGRMLLHHLSTPATANATPRVWTHDEQEMALGPVNDYVAASPDLRARHISQAALSTTYFRAHESWREALAVHDGDHSATRNLERHATSAWRSKLGDEPHIKEEAMRLFGVIIQRFRSFARSDFEKKIKEELLGKSETEYLTLLEFVLALMLQEKSVQARRGGIHEQSPSP